MKRLAILCTIGALCAGHVFSAENEKEEKKVPPGLQKKDGVAPGQAKKKGQATEATSTASPAAAPATATAPAAVAAPAPVTATAKPAAAPAKTITLADQKAVLEANTRAINQATEGKATVHTIALQHIAKETGVTVEHLREQDKNFPGASDTGLLLGNVIARKANVKFSDVIKARHAGKHWDEIAKAHNVDYGLLVQKSTQLAQALNAGGAR